MRTTIGIESLRRYLKCTSIALQHAYQHTVCSRADVGRRRVNPNADRVSRVAHAPLRFGRLDTIAAAPPTRHAAPNSMPFDDLAARREPDRFSATMRAALQTTPCEPSRRNPLPTCTWPGQNRRRPLAAIAYHPRAIHASHIARSSIPTHYTQQQSARAFSGATYIQLYGYSISCKAVGAVRCSMYDTATQRVTQCS